MLKVVGASWQKTRLIVIILTLVLIIAFFAVMLILYEIPTKHEDGKYAATVVWSRNIGFRVEFLGQDNAPDNIPREVARAYYKPDIHKTGWASIEIETTNSYPDWVQAYSAGLLEGSLCWQLIYWHWQNTIGARCAESNKLCSKIRNYLESVEKETKKHAKTSEEDEPFWHHVKLFYSQLDGLEDGWNIGVKRSRKDKEYAIPHGDFLWMNSVNEIRDLKLKYENKEATKQYSSLSFLKYLPNSGHKFLLAHATGRSYSEMLRVHKKYTFRFHETASQHEPVAASTITFTSYPGAIHSQDDYYQVYINNGQLLTIAGSDMYVNQTLITENVDQPRVPVGPRAIAACRLSKSAHDWGQLINHEGGTNIGAKQWIVIETSSYNISMWVVEQALNFSKASDFTESFKERGYWISAGIPFFEEAENILGSGNFTSLKLLEAIEMLQQNHENVTSTESLYDLMHMPEIIALGRADVIQYPTEACALRQGGLIDLKISDSFGDCMTIAGPPYSAEVGPFQWSHSILQNLPHKGQPDRWQYEPVKPVWVWNLVDDKETSLQRLKKVDFLVGS